MQGLLEKQGGAPFALIGHSLGGKVVMEVVQQLAAESAPLPSQAWVLDSQVCMCVCVCGGVGDAWRFGFVNADCHLQLLNPGSDPCSEVWAREVVRQLATEGAPCRHQHRCWTRRCVHMHLYTIRLNT